MYGGHVTTEAELIRDWYKAIKMGATCVACEWEQAREVKAGNVEFHHIDKSSKCDTLSNMAIKPMIPCLQYTVSPVKFALKLMKVAPLCPAHHKDLHRAEDRKDWPTLQHKYDLTGNPFYTTRIRTFRATSLDIAPPELVGEIYDGMLEKLTVAPVLV